MVSPLPDVAIIERLAIVVFDFEFGCSYQLEQSLSEVRPVITTKD
jgi:hypothetical protein